VSGNGGNTARSSEGGHASVPASARKPAMGKALANAGVKQPATKKKGGK